MTSQHGCVAVAVAASAAHFAACSGPPTPRDAGPVPLADAFSPPADAASVDASPSGDASPGLADLAINRSRAEVDLSLREVDFAADACELDPDEACIAAPGLRTLLHFAVETPNVGDADLQLGDPSSVPPNPHFEYSACHMHYHFQNYAEYRLIDSAGGHVAVGRKQAFCLLDSSRYMDDDSVPQAAKYSCAFQGIQRGWSDLYHTKLDCQFIDVTDVPPGQYTLEIELNADRTLPERSYDNNLVRVPVDLGSPDLLSPTEPCPPDADDHSTAGLHRECGWTLADTFDCEPGKEVNVGCSSGCGLGRCTGDAMLRVCDALSPDGSCSSPGALAENDNFGGSCPCKLNIECPASGQIAVYTAPFQVEKPYTCEVSFEP